MGGEGLREGDGSGDPDQGGLEEHHGAPGRRSEETECEDGAVGESLAEPGCHERISVLDGDDPHEEHSDCRCDVQEAGETVSSGLFGEPFSGGIVAGDPFQECFYVSEIPVQECGVGCGEQEHEALEYGIFGQGRPDMSFEAFGLYGTGFPAEEGRFRRVAPQRSESTDAGRMEFPSQHSESASPYRIESAPFRAESGSGMTFAGPCAESPPIRASATSGRICS